MLYYYNSLPYYVTRIILHWSTYNDNIDSFDGMLKSGQRLQMLANVKKNDNKKIKQTSLSQFISKMWVSLRILFYDVSRWR